MKKFIETLKNCWKIEDLRQRLLITLLFTAIYRFGSFVVLPGINPGMLENFSRRPLAVLCRYWTCSLVVHFPMHLSLHSELCLISQLQSLCSFLLLLYLISRRCSARARAAAKIQWYTRVLTVAILVFQAPSYL